MPRQHSANTIKKMKLSQQARRLREREGQRAVPVYEGNKIIGHINMGSNVDSFITLFRKSQVKHRKPKVTSSGKGCLFLTLLYFIGLPVYLWATQSNIYITEQVEAKIDNLSDVKNEEVKSVTQEIKIEPKSKIEVLSPLFDSTREDIENYIKMKFAPLGQEAIDWALFTANQESKFMHSPHNMQDDHSSWCDLENGSHGLYHFSICTFKGLGGVNIMNPYEQIDMVSRPEVYAERAFYWHYSTNKFEETKNLRR